MFITNHVTQLICFCLHEKKNLFLLMKSIENCKIHFQELAFILNALITVLTTNNQTIFWAKKLHLTVNTTFNLWGNSFFLQRTEVWLLKVILLHYPINSWKFFFSLQLYNTWWGKHHIFASYKILNAFSNTGQTR